MFSTKFLTDQNAKDYIKNLEKEKKKIESHLADLQLKYMGLCRIVGEGNQSDSTEVFRCLFMLCTVSLYF